MPASIAVAAGGLGCSERSRATWHTKGSPTRNGPYAKFSRTHKSFYSDGSGSPSSANPNSEVETSAPGGARCQYVHSGRRHEKSTEARTRGRCRMSPRSEKRAEKNTEIFSGGIFQRNHYYIQPDTIRLPRPKVSAGTTCPSRTHALRCTSCYLSPLSGQNAVYII
ncbi:hypothetical protein DFH07DRAFT_842907 [Mycena maculata]|uniref:Uncharacterized protein n=1 Tax=Mycena maculata TaxID=230809 RepID=A0AAD7I8D7_9AGAR|nr:hypothetical protein DFH07DRAFT_842907 [Mycena maculata]